MKTAKCISCDNRFKVQDWKVDEERTTCHTCLMIEKTMGVFSYVLTQTLQDHNKLGEIEIKWTQRK